MGQVTVQYPAGGDFWENIREIVETYGNTAFGSEEITLDMGKEYLVIAVSLSSAPWQYRAWELYSVRDGALSLVASQDIRGSMKKMAVTLSGGKLRCSHQSDYCYFTLAVVEIA